jgi:maltose alpha-D-glucosyltransferase/alpha-amylase
MYRRVEQGIHPDVETTRFLSLDTSNILTPSFLGTFEWMLEKENFSLGMVQQMVENHGTGESFMQERINNFIERLQASEKPLELLEINAGNLTNPVLFSELNSELQKLVGSTAADFCQQLGRKLAHLHKALANGGTQNQNFGKEPFSLHYQRSLFSGMQSLVRAGFDNLQKHTPRLPEDLHERSIKLQQKRNDLLEQLKRIYTKKLEAQKIRIHGHLTLGQILMTGRGLCFHDFGGRMSADFSERRLKRSPIRDLASLVRSIYIVTYKGFMQNAQLPSTQVSSLLPYARKWACLMSGFFIQSYLEDIEDAQLFPNDPKDLDMMIETFLLRGALIDLNEGFLEKEKAYAAFDLLENYLNA